MSAQPWRTAWFVETTVRAAEPEVVPVIALRRRACRVESDGQRCVAKLAGEAAVDGSRGEQSRPDRSAIAGWLQTRLYESAGLAAPPMKPMGKPARRCRRSSSSWRRSPSPQFTHRVSLLTDPAVSGGARCGVFDAMMGYSALYQRHPHQTRWLYSSTPYKMATPPSVINQWQLALDNGSCRRLSPARRRVIRSMRPGTVSRWRWWLIHVHGRR